MFKKPFNQYVCVGDRIYCVVAGFTIAARVERSDDTGPPDERDNGFWPSHDPAAPGYVIPENFDKAQAEAVGVMHAWRNDMWFYCGIVLEVSRGGVILDRHAASLWGIEANYPGSDNAYLLEVANELIPEAVEGAQKILAAIDVEDRESGS